VKIGGAYDNHCELLGESLSLKIEPFNAACDKCHINI
jgi:hypothetical protein